MMQIYNFIEEVTGKIKCKDDLGGVNEKHFKEKFYEITDLSLEPLQTHPGQVVVDVATFNIRIFDIIRNTKDLFESFGVAQSVRLKVASHITSKKYGITNVELGSLISNTEGSEGKQISFEFSVRLKINSEGIL